MTLLLTLPSSGTPGVSPTPSASDWDGHVNSVSLPLNFVNLGTAIATTTYTPDAVDHIADVSTMVAQFVSQVLPPQAVTNTWWTLSCQLLEDLAANNLFMRWKVYAVDAAGTSVLGTFVAIRSDGTEAGTALTGRTDSVVGSAVTLLEPWRLVLEVGFKGLPVAGGGTEGHNGGIRFGEATSEWCAEGETGTLRPYLVFDGEVRTYTGVALPLTVGAGKGLLVR